MPFYYLIFRAWSHWRAIAGGQHLQWLVTHKKLLPAPSETLDQLYDTHGPPVDADSPKEQVLITRDRVQTFSKTLDAPALEIELERAIWQVEEALGKAETTEAETKAPDKVGEIQEKGKDTTER